MRPIALPLLLSLVPLAGACAMPVQSESVVGSGDVTAYETELHPILETSCATLDCHGKPGRPLRLYAETGLRAPDNTDRKAPLTDAEYQANVEALLGVDPGASDLDHSIVLEKPLATGAGGAYHLGRDQLSSRTDPAYVCLRAFLAGSIDQPDALSACAEARSQHALPPP